MQVIYANQTPPVSWSSAIFLAGPTPRAETTVPSWRPEALKYLADQGYNGVVFVPEDEDGTWLHNYDEQIEWENTCLNFADVIIFWIPRELEQMPGFTTNDEWGAWKKQDPMKLILGTPPDAPKVRYQRYYAEKQNIPVCDSLEDVCFAAFTRAQVLEWKSPLGKRLRKSGERSIPLHIWNTASFQGWYENLVKAGNRLDNAKVEWVFRVGPTQQFVFFWVLHVDIYITAEDRHKINEVVIGRPDISTIMLYEKHTLVRDSRIVMVKEFRSPVSNKDGYVFELAGGSSWEVDQDPLSVAVEECYEEVGLRLSPNRFVMHHSRQVAATTMAHHAHLFSAELSTAEMDDVVTHERIVHGVHADSERTWAIVMTYGELLDGTSVDWSMIGMIASILTD